MTQHRTVDLLVIGATVAGLTTAVSAAAAGALVAVIDPNPISRFGTGVMSVAFGDTLRAVEVHRGIEACRTLITEANRAVAWLGETLPSYGATVTSRTAYSLAVDGHLAFHLRQEARLLRAGGLSVDFTDAHPIAPLVTRPSLVLTDQSQVDPRHHRDALRSAARAAGVAITTDVSLERFRPGQPWVVTFLHDGSTGEVSARDVLDTIGAAPWAWGTGGALRICPVVLTATDNLAPDLYLLVDTPAALVMTLRGTGVFVGHPVVPSEEHAATVDLVAFAARHGHEVTGVHSRHVEITTDRLPRVGRVPLLPGAWTARGFGLWETPLATAAGLQLVAALAGDTTRLPWAPLRAPAPLATYRRWNGTHSDPMINVPAILRRRGLAR